MEGLHSAIKCDMGGDKYSEYVLLPFVNKEFVTVTLDPGQENGPQRK